MYVMVVLIIDDFYPNTCMSSRVAVITIFMMVFDVTQLGQEPMTYC